MKVMKMMKVVAAAAVVVSALLVTGAQSTTPPPTGHPGFDLTGKMFTLSQENGGVRFYPSSYTPHRFTTWSYNTPAPHRASTTPFPWTTATPMRGLSVCVRYMADPSYDVQIFKLGEDSSGLELTQNSDLSFALRNYYFSVYLVPRFRLWSSSNLDMWTSVCLTLDNTNKVTQLFKDFSMSVRTLVPSRRLWSGEPVVEIPGFNGQVTDLQMWDYPLSYKEIYNYMRRGAFRTYQGSLLSWSNIGYSSKENTLLEDQYDVLAQQPMRGGGRGGGRGGRQGRRQFRAEENQQANGRPIF